MRRHAHSVLHGGNHGHFHQPEEQHRHHQDLEQRQAPQFVQGNSQYSRVYLARVGAVQGAPLNLKRLFDAGIKLFKLIKAIVVIMLFMSQTTVSVIIPSYNRFTHLLKSIESIKSQTLKPIEIIVVNDCSTEKEYYEYDWSGNDIIIIHLKKNSKKVFGFSCPGGYQRNFGIDIASGEYIAFCDDDDSWFPKKLELQINAIIKTGCGMSSTDGLIGNGLYDQSKTYKKYNGEEHYQTLQQIYATKGRTDLVNGFPTIWNLDFLKIHNCIICSSVVIKKEIIEKTGRFVAAKYADDYEYWLRILKHTNSVYVPEICFYYDNGHANGKLY